MPDDARGVLQDVHWAAGSFGYFPTYSLGNVIAGQIWARAAEALPDLDDQIGRGELRPLRDWLRERLYRHGAKLTPAEMIERVCGEPISVEPYLAQMRRKFGEIYGLSVTSAALLDEAVERDLEALDLRRLRLASRVRRALARRVRDRVLARLHLLLGRPVARRRPPCRPCGRSGA